MITKSSFLKLSEIPITDKIKVLNPKVSDVLDDENSYYATTSLLTSTPFALIVQLDDKGIDYENVSEFELFTMIIKGLSQKDLHLIIKGVEPENLQICKNEESDEIVLYDKVNDVLIDRFVSDEICRVLRKICGFKKDTGSAANKAAKKYIIDRKRRKLKRNALKPQDSVLEKMVISLVNNKDFPYDYDGALNLSLFQFNSSVSQIPKLKNYEQVMNGLYAGTVDSKHINLQDINWI